MKVSLHYRLRIIFLTRIDIYTAAFMYELGLRKTPDLPTILHLAARLDLQERTAALNYFLKHYEGLYRKDYKAEAFDSIRFIPAVEAGGGLFLGKPSEVNVTIQGKTLANHI